MPRSQTTIFFHFLALLLGAAALNGETVKVTSADPDAQTLTLEDGRTVNVGPGDARIGYVGKQIKGELEPMTDPPTLYAIWPVDPVNDSIEKSVNEKLHNDTILQGRKAFRSLGDYLPDFALYDQNGEMVRKNTFRGKNVVYNFIFTRCQMPKMCPATTARTLKLQKMLDASDLKDAHLVTITFDPEYDTPGILNEYAVQRGAHFDNYSLLTGDPDAIEDLMKQFGILTIAEDGTINHTMATIMTDGNGMVVYRKEGSMWSPQDFFDRLSEREKGQGS
ncbi:SCO family protein [Cerasicoccus fimbriatus]|uniref:SCO family protein n=1 Tax=Cerasicoccus fimbriatus TaxID=3014554 RepID=UPI0022B552F0|nr:SCO family protein [Cerasicoccus sp. TK19100]